MRAVYTLILVKFDFGIYKKAGNAYCPTCLSRTMVRLMSLKIRFSWMVQSKNAQAAHIQATKIFCLRNVVNFTITCWASAGKGPRGHPARTIDANI